MTTMRMSATLSGKNFADLVRAVTPMPSFGSFFDSDQISLEASRGVCRAGTFGSIESVSEIEVLGSFELFQMDERVLIGYSRSSENSSEVVIETEGSKVRIRNSEGRQIAAKLEKGEAHVINVPKSTTPILIDSVLAQKIGLLGEIAFADASEPSLNCVWLSESRKGIAVNHHCVAALELAIDIPKPLALPILIARLLENRFSLYISPEETVATNGISSYKVPSPAQAQEGFPIHEAEEFCCATKNVIATVIGRQLVGLVEACNKSLSRISNLAIVLTFKFCDGMAQLSAKNGASSFGGAIEARVIKMSIVRIPLGTIMPALPFLFTQATITVATGVGGESYLLLEDGLLMYPALKKKKRIE